MSSNQNSVTDFISRRTSWNYLPHDIQECFGNEREYLDEIKKYCFEHRITYIESGIKSYIKEEDYFREMVSYLKKHLLLYPYKFSTYLKNHLGVVPFGYYHDVLSDIMKGEKSYDTLPNFTAADTNRLIGVSRNEYIDIINRARSKKWMWKLNKTSTIKELLPKEAIPKLHMDYWWEVTIARGNLPSSLAEFVKYFNTSLSEGEQMALTLFFPDGKPNLNNGSGNMTLENFLGEKETIVLCGMFQKEALLSLYQKNLVFFHVPVSNNDYIMVPTLKNFIMNRKPTDYFEKIVYDILVTIDERTTLSEISNILDVPIETVKSAVSLCLRCNFARKRLEVPDTDTFHDDWELNIIQYHEVLATKRETWRRLKIDQCKKKRVAYIFDNSLTAHLMFGNLGPEIKRHAVTLFEIGKLTDEALDDFLKQLDTVKTPDRTIGEARVYYTHAISLRNTLRFLRKNKAYFPGYDEKEFDGGVDMLRCESLKHLDPPTKLKILKTNYTIILTQAPLRSKTPLPIGMPQYFGPPLTLMNTPWFRLYLFEKAKCGPKTLVFRKGYRVNKLPEVFMSSERVIFVNWDMEPSFIKNNVVIQTINESLLFSPVIIQVLEDNFDGAKSEIVKAVFPIIDEEEEVEGEKENEEEKVAEKDDWLSGLDKEHYGEEKEQVLQLMKRIINELHLHNSFGVVKFLRSKKSENDKAKFYPFDIDFGIPLEDDKLNKVMCENIAKKRLFEKAVVEKHDVEMKKLAQDFIKFMDYHIEYNFSLEMMEVFPTENMKFDGEKYVNFEL